VYRHQWYQSLYERMPEILVDAQQARVTLGLDQLPQRLGLYSGMSSNPGSLPDYVLAAITAANRSDLQSVRAVEDDIRSLVKDLFGAQYDCAVTNTCEAGLRVAVEVLMSPPILRRGDMYRARLLTPLAEDHDWAAAYGRPFPPKYKNITADRSVSAGELGMDAKCLANVDTVYVRMPGARYEVHGIHQNLVPILLDIDVAASAAAFQTVAERHAGELSGVLAIGYDTPGYGQAHKDERGAPLLLRRLGDCARRFDVPFLVDCASAIPSLGFAPDDIGADVLAWSMDKVSRAPTCGLLVGTEEALLPIRRALGIGGARHGHVSSHGKAAFSLADPGRDALVGLRAVLKTLHADPQRLVRPVHDLHRIVLEELAQLPATLRSALIVTCSDHMAAVEINYARTWDNRAFGLPLFTLEDAYVDLNPICRALEAMGVHAPSIYAGNILLSPGLGLVDAAGELEPMRARLAVRALVTALQIVCRHANLEF
jgi:hypothetical protein